MLSNRLNSERLKPFAEWSVDAVCGWFEEMGLGIYEDDLKKWLKNGAADMINATSLDIEKEISLKSALHRKKIVLALNEMTGKENDELSINAGKLDTVWVRKSDLNYRKPNAIDDACFFIVIIIGNALAR